MSMHDPRGVADLQTRRDGACVERIARGEQDAFAELFRRYGQASYGLALRVLGDAGLAEEVVQEVFLSVWRNASAYDGVRGSVRTWLMTQSHHRAVDVVRREEAERRRTTTSSPDVPAEPSTDAVVEEAWIDSRRRVVRAALDDLPDEQRHVLSLAYFDGLTQSQVALRVGVPLGTVKSRTLAALRRLRRALEEREDG